LPTGVRMSRKYRLAFCEAGPQGIGFFRLRRPHAQRNLSRDKQVKLVPAGGYHPVFGEPEFRPFGYSVRQ
jgi:hypothetical protein